MNQRGFANIALIIGIVILGGVAGYFVLVRGLKTQPTVQEPQPSNETITTTGINETSKSLKTAGMLEVKLIKTVAVNKRLFGGSHPKISHDGTRITYRLLGAGDGGLWVVNMDGNGLKKLTNDIPDGEGTYDFGWSPDDRYIFYVERNDWVAGVEPVPSSLKVVEVETGTTKILFRAPNRNVGIKSPQYISQKEIAFILRDEVNLSNSAVKVIDVNFPEIIPPPKRLTLYVWGVKGGTKEEPIQKSVIVAVNTDGVVKEIAPDEVRSVPSVSSDGKKLGYAYINGIVIMEADGSNPKTITTVGGGFPIFSPRDNIFAYYKTRDDGHKLLESDIYIMNVDGTEEKKLTESGNKLAMEPSWSPDGKKIVFFYAGVQEGENQIGIIELAESN
jgi:Tol biopolymer transport system component